MESLHFKFIFPLIFLLPAYAHGWGVDGHLMTCQIAQGLLTKTATDAINNLLPDYANNDLSSLCSWPDHVKFRYKWSSPLHYIDTPDNLCNYNYNRDCKDENEEIGRCVAGAITNYTNQLLDYKNDSSQTQYNLTEALLFLSHLMGDIHQPLHVGFTSDRGGNTIDVHWFTRKTELHHPLHVGFTSDRGGNTIDVHWFTRKTELHHVWDDSIIETAEEQFYDSNVDEYVDAINKNITGNWSSQVSSWKKCNNNETTCPDIYASESISAACNWAYKDVTEDSYLEDDYFQSRLPVVSLRLAQGGVRLASILNKIFG